MKSAGENKQLTFTASYRCTTKIGPTENYEITHPVTIDLKKDEPAEETQKRLEAAAKDLERTIQGCTKVKFTGLGFPATQTAERQQPATQKKEVAAQATISDRCAREWKGRPVCKK